MFRHLTYEKKSKYNSVCTGPTIDYVGWLVGCVLRPIDSEVI